ANRCVACDLQRRVALAMLDMLGLDAEPFGQERNEHGGVTLAGRLHVEPEHKLLATGKTQRSSLERHAAGMLQHAGKADAAIFAAPCRLAPALLESVMLGQRQCAVEQRLELAAVDRG